MSRLENSSIWSLRSVLLAALLGLASASIAHGEDASTPKLPASPSLKGLGKASAAKPAAAAAPKPVVGARPAPALGAKSTPAAGGKPAPALNAKPAPALSTKPAMAAAPAAKPAVAALSMPAPAPKAAPAPAPAKSFAVNTSTNNTNRAILAAAATPTKHPAKQGKAKHGKTGKAGKKKAQKWTGSGKASKHAKPSVAQEKPKAKPAAKPVVATPAPEKPVKPVAAAPVAAPKKDPLKPHIAKGLAAKAPADLAEDRKVDGDEPALETEDESGSSFWQILLVFLLFTTASAGTFVYLKRRNASGSESRGEDTDFAPAVSGVEEMPVSSHLDSSSSSDYTNTGISPMGDSTTEPCPFEQFVEMQVAQACWADQGADLVSHLRTHFNASMLEWSKISIYWKPRYLASTDLKQRFDQLEGELKIKYSNVA